MMAENMIAPPTRGLMRSLLPLVVGLSWVPACGGEECPDVSGKWQLTLACTERAGVEEEWRQTDCSVVRRSAAGENIGSATLEEDGVLTVMGANSTAPCRGSVKGDRIEVQCPSAIGQTCGPDTCCLARWQRPQ